MTKQENNQQVENKAKETISTKKAYTKPMLTNYGTISELTRGTGTHGNDGGTMTKN